MHSQRGEGSFNFACFVNSILVLITLAAFSIGNMIGTVEGFTFINKNEKTWQKEVFFNKNSIVQRKPSPKVWTAMDMSSDDDTKKKILIIGGNGRVGGSTIRALHKYGKQDTGYKLELLSGGRSQYKFEASKQRWESLTGKDYGSVGFRSVELDDHHSLCDALKDVDLVVHTAGPFQQKRNPEVLRAAIEVRVPYIDVCDDIELAQEAKKLASEAQKANIPAIVSAGIWPGVSSLMAAHCDEIIRSNGQNTEKVDFNFFTAGTGNAGPTILSATFLIIAEKVLTFQNGKKVLFPPVSDMRDVDFGKDTGLRNVFRMNLIEAYTCHKVLGIPNVATFFGTAPNAWNYLLKGMALLPKGILGNRELMNSLALFSEPLVRLVDSLVGATNVVKVDAYSLDGSRITALHGHENLEECVGIAIAGFATEILNGKTCQPGIWFPEEAFTDREIRKSLLEKCAREAFAWDLPKLPATTQQ